MTKKNQITKALMVALLAGTAQFATAQSSARGGYHGPSRPAINRPGDRREFIAARRAFDALLAAQNSASHYDFVRTIRILQNADYELAGIRNGYTNQARQRIMGLSQRLHQVLRYGDRRTFYVESRNAIRLIENAKTDLLRSGLLGRR